MGRMSESQKLKLVKDHAIEYLNRTHFFFDHGFLTFSTEGKGIIIHDIFVDELYRRSGAAIKGCLRFKQYAELGDNFRYILGTIQKKYKGIVASKALLDVMGMEMYKENDWTEFYKIEI